MYTNGIAPEGVLNSIEHRLMWRRSQCCQLPPSSWLHCAHCRHHAWPSQLNRMMWVNSTDQPTKQSNLLHNNTRLRCPRQPRVLRCRKVRRLTYVQLFNGTWRVRGSGPDFLLLPAWLLPGFPIGSISQLLPNFQDPDFSSLLSSTAEIICRDCFVFDDSQTCRNILWHQCWTFIPQRSFKRPSGCVRELISVSMWTGLCGPPLSLA